MPRPCRALDCGRQELPGLLPAALCPAGWRPRFLTLRPPGPSKERMICFAPKEEARLLYDPTSKLHHATSSLQAHVARARGHWGRKQRRKSNKVPERHVGHYKPLPRNLIQPNKHKDLDISAFSSQKSYLICRLKKESHQCNTETSLIHFYNNDS